MLIRLFSAEVAIEPVKNRGNSQNCSTSADPKITLPIYAHQGSFRVFMQVSSSAVVGYSGLLEQLACFQRKAGPFAPKYYTGNVFGLPAQMRLAVADVMRKYDRDFQ